MRVQNSITDQAFNAINAVGVGNTFTVNSIYNRDMRCGSMYGQRQRLYDILCFLNKTGLIERVKRGTYKVMFKIPENLTFTDIESYSGYRSTYNYNTGKNGVRKKNPFDIDAYKASFSTPHSCGNVVEVTKASPETKTIYIVDMKSAVVSPTTVMRFDTSYLMMPNAFEDEDSADAFAEGIVVPESEEDVELENALEEIDNDIAETLFRESDPASDPQYTEEEVAEYDARQEAAMAEMNKDNVNYTLHSAEEQFEDAKQALVNECEPEAPGNGVEFVKILIKPGTQVFIIEQEKGYMARMIKDIIDDCQIYVNQSGIKYDFNTCEGYDFGKDALGVTVFTDKVEAVNALSELL